MFAIPSGVAVFDIDTGEDTTSYDDGLADLRDWLTKAVGEELAAAVPGILDHLKKHYVIDVKDLKSVWEDVKEGIPGMPRVKIAEKCEHEKWSQVSFDPIVQVSIWYQAFPFALGIMAVTGVVGAFKDKGMETRQKGLREEGWYESWVPLLVLGLLENMFVSYVAPMVGYDMIQERSAGVHMKDTMRSSMTNQGVVGALMLTVVVASLQADAEFGQYNELMAGQWYCSLLTLSLCQLIIAVMIASFATLYLEPLDDVAALKFVGDNFMYFGEPLAYILTSSVNSIIAIILWVFAAYGFALGFIASFTFGYTVLRTLVVYRYLQIWVNPFLPHHERKAREAEAKSIATTTGKIKDHA
jgi:hypothetical protein